MNFGSAIDMLRCGKTVTRSGWNGKGMFLRLQVPDTNSKMSLPYIYMYTAQGHFIPWVASHSDILASDWDIVAEEAALGSSEQKPAFSVDVSNSVGPNESGDATEQHT